MDTKKFLTGTLVGGIAYFFLGYLIYGMALEGFMASHAGTATGVAKSMDEMVWWALIVGNLSWAAMFSYIFLKWANIKSFGGGASAGAIIGLLMALGFDMVMFATSNVMDMTGMLGDVAAATVMNALAGGAIGAALGMGSKS